MTLIVKYVSLNSLTVVLLIVLKCSVIELYRIRWVAEYFNSVYFGYVEYHNKKLWGYNVIIICFYFY